MNQQQVLDIGAETIMVAIKVAAPALIATLVMGLIISIFQAATQINEQTLSFIPKVLAMTLVMVWTGPWILQTLIFFTSNIFKSIAKVTQ